MKVLLPLLILVFCSFGFSQTIPKFTDYPARQIYTGKNAPLILGKDDLMFRTRLRWAARHQKVNFAGHLILTFWGCGTSCIQGSAIDAKTGKIYDWGFSTAASDAQEIVRFQKDSNLVIFHGSRDEADGDDGDHYYKFNGQKFIEVKTILSKDQRTNPPAPNSRPMSA